MIFVNFVVRVLLSLAPSRLFLACPGLPWVVDLGFCSSSSDFPISSFCPLLPLFLLVLCTAIGKFLPPPRRFSLPFLRDRVILRLEVFFLSCPSRLFLMVRFGFCSSSARFPGFLFLSSASSVPLRFKG